MSTPTKPAPISEFSAFGILLCCVGFIWTIISFFKAAGNISAMQSKHKILGFAIFIPIFGQLTAMWMAEGLNEAIKEKNLKAEPLNPVLTLVLAFVFAPVAWFLIFKKHNEVAAQL